MKFYDRENEIDLIALNEFDKTGIISTIKRNPNKVSIADLDKRITKLPDNQFGDYKFTTIGLSINEM